MKQFFEKIKRTNSILLLFVAVCICCTISFAFAKYITTIRVGTFNLTVEGGTPEVFAVYSEDGNSLTFYNRGGKPTAGATFNGKVVTEVYTEFESLPKYTSQMPWKDQCANIISVDFADTISPTNTGYWFYQMTNLKEITHIENLDTSKVINMDCMFHGCSNLESIDVSRFNTDNVTSMASMFLGCSKLTTLDLSSFNTSKNTYLMTMFSGCSNLVTIYASENFKIPTNRLGTFDRCDKLIGGSGSTIASVQESGVPVKNSTSGDYARIDGGTEAPGYFTLKPPAT